MKLQQILAYHPLRTIRCVPPPFFPGGFAGGTGGTVASSRAAISSLVSFSLGLDRPSSEFLLVMFPPCLSFPRFGSRNPLCQLGGVQVFTNRLQVRTTAVTSMFTVPPSSRSAPCFR